MKFRLLAGASIDLNDAAARYGAISPALAHAFLEDLAVARTRNVFIDLGFPPHEAAVMLLRAQLAEALRSWMEQNELTQAQAARKLGISQPRLSEITRGKVELLAAT